MELSNAVVVITGASSGIGKATALAFAERGANLVLAARRPDALEETAAECRMLGVEALPVVTDVSSEHDVAQLAARAVERFGHFDVWVNDAGVYLVARADETPMDLHRRIIETNYFGVVHGSLQALRHFRERGEGVLINVSSLDGKVAMPYVGAYVSSKHAVKGFDEVLQQELIGTDIHVCTIMPGPVDTPLFGHAANFMGKRLRPPAPVYDPEKVAAAILSCAISPQNEVAVGGVTKLMGVLHSVTPSWLFGRGSKKYADTGQFMDEHAAPTAGNLYEPANDGSAVHGGWKTSGGGAPAGIIAPVLLAVPAGFAAWFWLRSRGKKDKNAARMQALVASAKVAHNVNKLAKSKPAKNVRKALEGKIDRKKIGKQVAAVRETIADNVDRKKVAKRVEDVRDAISSAHVPERAMNGVAVAREAVNGVAKNGFHRNGKKRGAIGRVVALIRR